MTFDHRPGTTKVGDLATLARSGCTGLFEAELAKCDLVCANCHAIRTYLRREQERALGRPVVSEPPAFYAGAAKLKGLRVVVLHDPNADLFA